MEKRIKTFLRRYLLIAIALSLIIFVAGFSFAEFTKSEKAKRVVAAYASTGQMFSSNVLRVGGYRKTLFVEKEDVAKIDGDDPDIAASVVIETTVTICNYIQGNPRQFYGKNNAYTLTGTLVTLESNGERALSDDYNITINDVKAVLTPHSEHPELAEYNEYKWTFSDTLPGGSRQDHVYKISIPGAVLRADDKVYLKLEAVPTKYADIQDNIYAYIEIAEKPEAVKAGWTIECTDQGIQENFSEFYGYNWRLSGIGQGRVTLSWVDNVDKVYLSEACLQNLKNLYPNTITDTSIATGTLVIMVNSDVTTSSYDLQFYPKIDPISGERVPGSYNDIVVTCDYSESNS